jgi:hypothetical protein
MSTRSHIIDLINAEDEESLKQLHALLAEAANNPTAKLSSKAGTVQTKTIKVSVPSKWISPPNLAHAPSDNISSSGSSSSKSKSLSGLPGSVPQLKKVPSMIRSNSISSSSSKSATTTTTDSSSNRASNPTAGAAAAPVPGSEEGQFCTCGSLDDNDEETFIKCSVGKGGCNGWIHLRCAEDLTESQKDDIILNKSKHPRYVCTLCKEYVKKNRKPKKDDDGDDEYEPSSEPEMMSPSPSSSTTDKKRGPLSAREIMMKKLKSSRGGK